MHPSQLKRILEALRSSSESLRAKLDVIKETIKEEGNAISINGKSASNEQRKGAEIIARAIQNAADSQSSYEQPQRHKEHRLQITLVILTFFAASGAIFAAFASWRALGPVKESADAEKGVLEQSLRPQIAFADIPPDCWEQGNEPKIAFANMGVCALPESFETAGSFYYRLTNNGGSAAYVYIQGKIIPQIGSDLTREANGQCEEARREIFEHYPITVAPKFPETYGISYDGKKNESPSITEHMLPPFDARPFLSNGKSTGFSNVGCIAYRVPDCAKNSCVYQTPFRVDFDLHISTDGTINFDKIENVLTVGDVR